LKILGLSASLRNKRFGRDADDLLSDLVTQKDLSAVASYLGDQSRVQPGDLLDGVHDEADFEARYRRLRAARRNQGLSNSESVTAAALWGAMQAGAEVSYRSLADHFPAMGAPRLLDTLREEILTADGLLLTSPVYFGDRSSLAQNFIDFISSDPELAARCSGKLFAGCSVGAKRNGGQETTLVYLISDFLDLGFLIVGNGPESSVQYGGTAVAGDVGKVHSDTYGMQTAAATGARMAGLGRVLANRSCSSSTTQIQTWLVADSSDGAGAAMLGMWAKEVEGAVDNVSLDIIDMTREQIIPCLACDLCPTESGPREAYRCTVTRSEDLFVRRHSDLITADAILLAAYVPDDLKQRVSVYQQFMERTRYLRRDHYVFSDRLCAALVLGDTMPDQRLALRMTTSLIRHQAILHSPLVATLDKATAPSSGLVETGIGFAARARDIKQKRQQFSLSGEGDYRPIGYDICARLATLVSNRRPS
jgi:multimeric flavodoxin WrbA